MKKNNALTLSLLLLIPFISGCSTANASSSSDYGVTTSSKSFEYDTNDYVYIGKTLDKTYASYNDFSMYAKRSDESIVFLLVGGKATIKNSGYVNLYLNSGTTSDTYGSGDYVFKLKYDGEFVVYDYSFSSNMINKSVYSYSVSDTALLFEVPYSSIYGYTSGSILGISFGEYYEPITTEIAMMFDEVTTDVSDTTTYARIDANNKIFANTVNENNDKWISKEKKRELLDGKDYSFALTKYQTGNPDADDFYLGIDRSDSGYIKLSFVGFGEFTSDEYVNMIIHNSAYHKTGWAILSTDMILVVKQDGAYLYTGQTSFFAYADNTSLSPSKTYGVTFYEETAYFTIDVSIPFSDLSSIISSQYESFSFVTLEFGSTGVYNSDVSNNMFYKSSALGDAADQSNYAICEAYVTPTELSSEEKAALVESMPLSFANPDDVQVDDADDFYFSVSSDSEYLNFDMIGFGVFNKNETISVSLHQGDDLTGWTLASNDYHFLVTRESVSYSTGDTNFFTYSNVNYTNGTTISEIPTFTQYEGYFTFTFSIPLSVLTSLDLTSSVYGYCMEFCNGTVYNANPWIYAMRYNGVACGDPAATASYVVFM